MNHLEFAQLETAMLTPCPIERGLARIEALMGHSLDGNQATDGYSLDFAVEYLQRGDTPEEIAAVFSPAPEGDAR